MNMDLVQIEVVKQRESKTAHIVLRSDDILHVHFKKDSVLDLEAQIENRDIFIEMCGNQKYPYLYSAAEGVTITMEARNMSRELEASTPASAIAIEVSNLAYKLIADFYYRFNKPSLPYRVFRNREAALMWLENFKN